MAISAKDSGSPGRVVVGFDGSPASMQALRWALNYARFTRSATEVIVAWDCPPKLGLTLLAPIGGAAEMSAEQMLDHLIGQLRDEYTRQLIEGRVVQGQAAPLLVEASKGADLLVVGSRGHGELVGMLIGSVSEYCATNAHCPVLVHKAVA
jgi:nucleotide-binding universal stress UspA family protein